MSFLVVDVINLSFFSGWRHKRHTWCRFYVFSMTSPSFRAQQQESIFVLKTRRQSATLELLIGFLAFVVRKSWPKNNKLINPQMSFYQRSGVAAVVLNVATWVQANHSSALASRRQALQVHRHVESRRNHRRQSASSTCEPSEFSRTGATDGRWVRTSCGRG